MPKDELDKQMKPGAHHNCAEAWMSGAVSGCLAGLVSGMIWGIIQEKKFIFRNMSRELHLREPPIQLFSVMMRGTKTMAIMGTFFGRASHSWLPDMASHMTKHMHLSKMHILCRRVTGATLQLVH